ncbi:hypothetical protein [Streptomyces sp. Ac-502]|uniref:hypothetical protein n=1 Tax=Streptomyces sp. Ac-502 TaxID=3342801 RepID=UPI0038622938
MSSIVQNGFQAIASGDPDRAAAVLTEDTEWLNATAIALKTTHHMVGRKAIVRFFADGLPVCSRATSFSPSTGSTPPASGWT